MTGGQLVRGFGKTGVTAQFQEEIAHGRMDQDEDLRIESRILVVE
jgi:hypothetical protein